MVLGPNEAEKSTILKMVTGILRPTFGCIVFNGHSWNREDLKEIGALIETPPLYENLTACENLKARTLALCLPACRIDEALEMVRLRMQGKRKRDWEHTGLCPSVAFIFIVRRDNRRQILLFFPVPHSIFIHIASVRGLGVSEQSSSCAVRLFIKVIIAAINEDPACHHTALGIV